MNILHIRLQHAALHWYHSGRRCRNKAPGRKNWSCWFWERDDKILHPFLGPLDQLLFSHIGHIQSLVSLELDLSLVGGWATPLKNMSSSIRMMTFPIFLGKCQKNGNQLPPTSSPWPNKHQPSVGKHRGSVEGRGSIAASTTHSSLAETGRGNQEVTTEELIQSLGNLGTTLW